MVSVVVMTMRPRGLRGSTHETVCGRCCLVCSRPQWWLLSPNAWAPRFRCWELPLPGIVLGVALTPLRRGSILRPGINIAGKVVPQVTVVLLAAPLALGQVAHVGLNSLPVTVGTLLACLLVAHFAAGDWASKA